MLEPDGEAMEVTTSYALLSSPISPARHTQSLRASEPTADALVGSGHGAQGWEPAAGLYVPATQSVQAPPVPVAPGAQLSTQKAPPGSYPVLQVQSLLSSDARGEFELPGHGVHALFPGTTL